MSILKASALEQYLFKSSPFQLFAISIVSGMLVLFSRGFVKIDQLPVTHNSIEKEVGLFYTPNWAIVYLVLFPLFLVLLSEQSTFVRNWLQSALAQKCIITDDGNALDSDNLLHCLDVEIASYDSCFRYLMFVTAVVALGGWVLSCYLPLSRWTIVDEAIGWGVAPIIVDPFRKTFSQEGLIGYTLLAYAWMGLALYIYISCLWFNLIYANFFFRLAHGRIRTSGGVLIRMVSRKDLPSALADYLYRFLAASFLGLVAAFLMQLESQFLLSDERSISNFWFGDLTVLMRGQTVSFVDFMFPKGHFQAEGSRDQTRFTSLAVLAATAVAFGAGIWLIQGTLKAARSYTLSILPNISFLEIIDLHPTKADIKSLQADDAMKKIFPSLKTSFTLCLGVILCTLFPRWGTVFSALIVFAAFRYVKKRLDSVA